MSVGAEQGQEAGMEALGVGSPASTFGKYHLFATLGRGGMADVFLSIARGPMGFNKLAVIKRLRSNLADDPAFRNMFLDEARLAARLNHPNIVHTYEVGEKDGNYFIAMEYLEGQSLNKIIREAVKRNEVFDQAFCARIISDALAGLECAHALVDYDGRPLNIIHRDVSPHNVFVTYGGQAKLVDFGIAKAALSSTETEIGVLKGKVAYMSPEQAVGGPIDRRADVFSMGICLWEMLTRQRLMTGDSAASTLHRLLHLPIPAVSSVRADIDPELDAIVGRALEKEPRFRFQTAQEMRDALDSFLTATGRPIRQDEIGRKMSSMFSRVREEVQKQIQEHMAKVTAATSTEELALLNAEAIRRAGNGMGSSPSSAQLMRLGVSGGSGSGIVPNFSGYSAAPGFSQASQPVIAAEPKKSRLAVILLSVVVGILAIAVIFLYAQGQRGGTAQANKGDPPARGPEAPRADNSGSASGAGQAGQATGAATGIVGGSGVGVVPQPGTSPGTSAASGAMAGSPVHSGRVAQSGGGRTRTQPPPHPTGTAASGPAPAEKADDGFLTLDTYPWTKVSEGGRVLGTTPILRVPLAAGSHTLTLENPDDGIKQSFTVTIKSGETFNKRLGLK
ncbi:protein kinase domain-containing protein [Pendulispora albinea]|uniref:Protein kinase n=1 Tax=Pendulispora albinea TaxID=2741071 RepID=A0ABZ2M896_9BACT